MSDRHSTRVTAALLVAGALVVNLAFAGLGAVFGYPDVLAEPAELVLTEFRAHQPAIIGWFVLLAAGAALLAPIAVRLGRLGGGSTMRLAVPVGVAAAAVQVVGLARWPLAVPGLAAQAVEPATAASAAATFGTLSLVLGTVLGETVGYVLTAAWTLLVVAALRPLLGRALAMAGTVAAALIATGVAVPLGLPGADVANFVGYLLWSLWLVALAVRLVRADHAPLVRPQPARSRARCCA